jgi:Dyp-type peroxidase family
LQDLRGWVEAAGGRITRVESYFHWRPAPAARWACREPFGFADGISNPEFFANAAPNHWSIDLSLDRVMIDDRGPHHGGSFLVVRKLEQNVAAFRAFEEKLAATLRAELPAARAGEAAHLAEGVIIGRDREGVPLVGLEGENLNDFTFRGDARALRCPFHAHIRKANPRDDDPFSAAIAPDDARQLQFVRRSFVYGDPARLTLDGPDWPEGGVGLWFMGYMRDIEEQFREMQARWMRDPRFPAHSGDALPDPLLFGGEYPGVDPVTTWAWAREGRATCVAGLSSFVRPRGGEYFYVPSLRWLSACESDEGMMAGLQPRPSRSSDG